jgi:hypothetical protein
MQFFPYIRKNLKFQDSFLMFEDYKVSQQLINYFCVFTIIRSKITIRN